MNGQKVRSHIRKHGGEAEKPAAGAKCVTENCTGKATVLVKTHPKKVETTNKIYCTNCAKAAVLVQG